MNYKITTKINECSKTGKEDPGWFTLHDASGALYHRQSIDELIALTAPGSAIHIDLHFTRADSR